MSRLIRVGQIVGAFGIKGQVKVEPLTDFIEDRFDLDSTLYLKGEQVSIQTIADHKSHLIVKFKGIDDRTQAESLQWAYLEAPEDERPDLEEDEFMLEDLIGLAVITTSGERLGNVSEVLFYPAQDIIIVGEHQIPMVKEFVKDVDLEAGEIKVELIEGM